MIGGVRGKSVLFLFGICLALIILALFGFFISCVLVINPNRKMLEDKALMDWIKEYQEKKAYRLKQERKES